MSLTNLFSLGYWFSLYTDPFDRGFFWLLVIAYLVAIAIGAWSGRKVIRLRSSDKFLKLGFQKIATFGYSFGLVGLLLLFFRQQSVQVFGMRAWAWAWWLICLVWLIFIIKFFVVELPKMKEEKRKKQEFQKYL